MDLWRGCGAERGGDADGKVHAEPRGRRGGRSKTRKRSLLCPPFPPWKADPPPGENQTIISFPFSRTGGRGLI